MEYVSYYSLQIQIISLYCTHSWRETAKVSFLPFAANVMLNLSNIGVPNQSSGSWTLFFCKSFFRAVNLCDCWPREWKRSINSTGSVLKQCWVMVLHSIMYMNDKLNFNVGSVLLSFFLHLEDFVFRVESVERFHSITLHSFTTR